MMLVVASWRRFYVLPAIRFYSQIYSLMPENAFSQTQVLLDVESIFDAKLFSLTNLPLITF